MFDSVIKPVVELLNNLMTPLLAIVGAAGALYCVILGVKYAKAEEPQDREKGLEYYKKAAELGNARSMYALGYAYQCGQGVEADLQEALRWYEKAALAGHANALAVWNAYTGE